MRQRSAIHVATAARWNIKVLETHDKELIALNGRVGNPAITIRLPHFAETLALFLPVAKDRKATTKTAKKS